MAHRLSAQAEAELDDIWYYIANQSGNPEIADRFVRFLTERFSFLALNPHVGRKRDIDLRSGLRSFPVDNYVILYRIDGVDVLILHVFWGGRDIPTLIL